MKYVFTLDNRRRGLTTHVNP